MCYVFGDPPPRGSWDQSAPHLQMWPEWNLALIAHELCGLDKSFNLSCLSFPICKMREKKFYLTALG